MPQPCCGSSASVFRISRSSVPCGSSIRLSSKPVSSPLLYSFDMNYNFLSCRRARGRYCGANCYLGMAVLDFIRVRRSRVLGDSQHTKVRQLRDPCSLFGSIPTAVGLSALLVANNRVTHVRCERTGAFFSDLFHVAVPRRVAHPFSPCSFRTKPGWPILSRLCFLRKGGE